ncbi:Transposase [Methylobacterium sp. UNC300MFChir4.1]|nr:Transposase [Methylobacterium sp. UNC300MFChir4.1]
MAEKGGATAQAIGPSRGGQTTKIHALTDVLGRPGVLLLTPGNASDVTTVPAVLAEAPGRIQRLAADKGYDADWLRADLRKSGITPVIPGKRGRKRKIRHDKSRYRERWRIEATFNRLKDFRRIATRYDKLARNYASALALAAVIAFWS